MTNIFPGVGYITHNDWNYFKKITVMATTFGGGSTDGYQPDLIVPFANIGFYFLNEGTGIIEYSFTGLTVHGELDGSASSNTKFLLFPNRVVNRVWYRIKAGSSSSTISLNAWAGR